MAATGVLPYQTGIAKLPAQNGGSVATATPTAQNTATSNLAAYNSSNQLPSQAMYNPTLLNTSSLAQVNPAYYNGTNVGQAAQYGGAQLGQTALVDPNQVSSITQSNSPDLSANATIAQILQGFQPEQQQQQSQLAQQLAASGLSGGPAIAAQNQLSTQLTQALAPTIASAIQQSQSNQMNQGQFNSNALIQALTGNANATNTANQNQAQLNQTAGLANQSALNSNQQLQAQLAQQSGLANADAANTANTANVGAYNSTLAANNSALNTAQQQYLQQLQNQWLDQFSAFNSINDAALGAQNNISVAGANNFGVNSSDPFASLGSTYGSLYSPTAKAAPTVASK